MSINAISPNVAYTRSSAGSSSKVAFKAGEAPSSNEAPKASNAKKWGVGIASAFLTGLGQAINKEWGKAAAFFGGSVLAGALLKNVPALKVPICITLGVMSIVDAVKNAGKN